MEFHRAFPLNLSGLYSPVRLIVSRRSLLATILLIATVNCVSLRAGAQIPNRINGRVDSAQLLVLRDHHPQWAIPQNNVGPASSEMVLTLVLARSAVQQAAFDQLVADQQNPRSPEFHHWLTPAQIGGRFGLSDSDITTITGWLQAQGLHINFVSPSRTFIGFGGKADIVGRAFHTEVHNYRVNGLDRFSVSSDPMLPAAIAPVIKSIQGLYTIEERPTSQMMPARMASPDATASNGAHFIAPVDFDVIYNIPAAYNGFTQTIGIVGRARTYAQDFDNFAEKTSGFNSPTEVVPTAFGGIDPGPPLTAPPTSGASFGDQGEATLDVMRAGTTAPSANLLLVVATSASGGVEVDAQYLVETTPLPAQIMTISFGACESSAGPSGVSFWNALFEQAAAEGISAFVSSGDSGAAGCDAAFSAPPSLTVPISPNYICSSSYATCVGGTEFNDFTNPSAYWSTNNNSGLGSVLGYIPEGGWNEPTSGTGTSVAASGGGISSYVATPAWQTGTGVPAARTGRYTPDVSFSSSCHDGYFACFAAGGGSCVTQPNGGFSFVSFCGTSAAAPAMAGVTALLNQKMGFSQGNLNPELYHLATSAPTTFHDTTVSSSGVSSCSVNTPSMCNNSAPGPAGLSGGEAGYLVNTGYDLVTGLGSLNVSNFLNNFSASLVAPTVTVTPSASTITAEQSLSVAVTVAGGSGNTIPTGTVIITTNDTYSSMSFPLVGGKVTITIPAGALPASGQTVTLSVQYDPDTASSSIYRAASGTANVTVTWITPTVTVTPSPSSPTTAQNLVVVAQVNGGSGNPSPTGQVYLTIRFPSGILTPWGTSSYGAVGTLISGSFTFTVPAGFLPPGTNTLTANYTPDSSGSSIYGVSSTANPTNIQVSGIGTAASSMTITPSAASVTTAQPFTVSATVATAPGFPPAAGVMFLSAVNGLGISVTVTNGSGIFSIAPGDLPVGANKLTVSYLGDFNYTSASGSTTVSVNALTQTTPTVTITPSASTISSTQPLNVSVTVAGGTGYPTATGTVSLTSGSYSTALAFNNGTWAATIPGGSLPLGNDALSVSYTPDANSAIVFNTATGTASVTVVAAAYTLAATAVTIAPGASGTSNVTVSSENNYVGTVSFKCSVTSSPAGASDIPSCTASQTVTLSSTTASGHAVVTVSSTASTAALHMPALRNSRGWVGGAGSAMVALVLFFVPRRRRLLRWIPIALFALVLFGPLVACGGGGGSGSTPPPNPGTTAGTYTLTITATGDDAAKSTASTTFSLTVN